MILLEDFFDIAVFINKDAKDSCRLIMKNERTIL